MMKKKVYFILFFGLLFLNSSFSFAQCTDFAKGEGLKILNTEKYIHDGRFNSIKLKQGDDIYIYKAFYEGENYRMVIVAEEDLGAIKIQMTDFKREKTIFSNDNGEKYFDFSPKKSQRTIIHIVIPPAQANQKANKGCVAIVFGLKKETKDK